MLKIQALIPKSNFCEFIGNVSITSIGWLALTVDIDDIIRCNQRSP